MAAAGKGPICREDVVRAVKTSVSDLFATMLNLPLDPGEPFNDAGHPMAFDGIVALVGIAGAWTGTGRISCSPRFACHLAGALLSTPFDSVNEEVLDAMAEIANMVIGNVKTHIEERLGPLGLSIPTVIYGRNYQTRSAGVLEWIAIPFRCGDETVEVRFCLMPASQPHPLHSSDLFHSFA
jgi:chemotaxis protein CheX